VLRTKYDDRKDELSTDLVTDSLSLQMFHANELDINIQSTSPDFWGIPPIKAESKIIRVSESRKKWSLA
jgi:hypothetical protein